MRRKHTFHEESPSDPVYHQHCFSMKSLASNNLQGLHIPEIFFYCFDKNAQRRNSLSSVLKLVKQYVAENERLRAILGEWSMRAAKVHSSILSKVLNVSIRGMF